MSKSEQPPPSSEVTLREAATACPTTTPGSEATLIETPDAASPAAVPLAAGLDIGGWRLREAIKVTSGEADLWVAAGKDSQTAVVKVFRWGLRPKAEIEAKLSKVSRAQVVEVYGRGVLPDGRHYEVLEHIKHGTLAGLGKGGLPSGRVKEVLKELADAVEALHQAGILHRDLKPSNVLVRTVEPLDLVLTDFGISSLAELSLHATSAARTAAYSAPEAMTGVVSRASDWWSVGVMVLELLRGAHPFAGLDERAVNFQLVTRGIEVPLDFAPDWALLVKGLLTRDHAKRWGIEQVRAWLEGKRNLTVHYTTAAAAAIGQKPYRFQGQEYGDAAGLAVVLAEHWEEGVKHWGRGYVLQWVEKDLGDQDLASQLHDVQDDKDLPTAELQLGAAVLAMNTELPLSYRGELVTTESLATNWEAGRHVLDSGLPQWVKRLRDESWLEDAVQRWKTGVEFAERSGTEFDGDAAGRLLVSGNRIVVDDLVAERQSKYVKGRKQVLTNLLGKKILGLNEAVLLASAAEREFYTQQQVLVDDALAWMDQTRIRYDKGRAVQLILAGDRRRVYADAEKRRMQLSRGCAPAANVLLQKERLNYNDAVLLLSAQRGQFLTPEEVLVRDGLAWLDGRYVTYDKQRAAELLAANNWDVLMPLVEERRTKCLGGKGGIIAGLLRKPELEYWEGVLLATAGPALFETQEDVCREKEDARRGKVDERRRKAEKLAAPMGTAAAWFLGLAITAGLLAFIDPWGSISNGDPHPFRSAMSISSVAFLLFSVLLAVLSAGAGGKPGRALMGVIFGSLVLVMIGLLALFAIVLLGALLRG